MQKELGELLLDVLEPRRLDIVISNSDAFAIWTTGVPSPCQGIAG